MSMPQWVVPAAGVAVNILLFVLTTLNNRRTRRNDTEAQHRKDEIVAEAQRRRDAELDERDRRLDERERRHEERDLARSHYGALSRLESETDPGTHRFVAQEARRTARELGQSRIALGADADQVEELLVSVEVKWLRNPASDLPRTTEHYLEEFTEARCLRVLQAGLDSLPERNLVDDEGSLDFGQLSGLIGLAGHLAGKRMPGIGQGWESLIMIARRVAQEAERGTWFYFYGLQKILAATPEHAKILPYILYWSAGLKNRSAKCDLITAACLAMMSENAADLSVQVRDEMANKFSTLLRSESLRDLGRGPSERRGSVSPPHCLAVLVRALAKFTTQYEEEPSFLQRVVCEELPRVIDNFPENAYSWRGALDSAGHLAEGLVTLLAPMGGRWPDRIIESASRILPDFALLAEQLEDSRGEKLRSLRTDWQRAEWRVRTDWTYGVLHKKHAA